MGKDGVKGLKKGDGMDEGMECIDIYNSWGNGEENPSDFVVDKREDRAAGGREGQVGGAEEQDQTKEDIRATCTAPEGIGQSRGKGGRPRRGEAEDLAGKEQTYIEEIGKEAAGDGLVEKLEATSKEMPQVRLTLTSAQRVSDNKGRILL